MKTGQNILMFVNILAATLFVVMSLSPLIIEAIGTIICLFKRGKVIMNKKVFIAFVVFIFIAIVGCAHTGRVNMQIGNPGESLAQTKEKINMLKDIQGQIDKLKAEDLEKSSSANAEQIKNLETIRETLIGSLKVAGDGDGVKYYDNWANSGDVEKWANAYAIKKDADIRVKISEQIITNSNNYALYPAIIINDDPDDIAYIAHPEKTGKEKITPNSYTEIMTKKIPRYLTVFDDKGNYHRANVQKDVIYNGKNYAYGIRINQIK